MTIAILLPKPSQRPVGGYKVVYEYANRLAEIKGVSVKIYYSGCYSFSKKISPILAIWGIVRFLYYSLGKIKISWFLLNESIKQKYVLNHTNKAVEDADVYIATALLTSFDLAKMNKKNSFYFIQGFEDWSYASKDLVYDSYKLPLKKIVISDGLLNEVRKVGQNATLIPNGFNTNVFFVSKTQEQRNPFIIATMYHKDELKGFPIVFEALNRVKKKLPQLKVLCFSAFKKPDYLPDWYHFTYKATEKDLHLIYNQAAIYVSASYSEGWGLTVGEAMNCGCAVCCTDNDGFKMMVQHNKTGLMSECGDITALENNIISLIKDVSLREKLVNNAKKTIANYSLDNAFLQFRNTIGVNG